VFPSPAPGCPYQDQSESQTDLEAGTHGVLLACTHLVGPWCTRVLPPGRRSEYWLILIAKKPGFQSRNRVEFLCSEKISVPCKLRPSQICRSAGRTRSLSWLRARSSYKFAGLHVKGSKRLEQRRIRGFISSTGGGKVDAALGHRSNKLIHRGSLRLPFAGDKVGRVRRGQRTRSSLQFT